MANAEAREKMMEAARQLQNEFKNPEPDPFRRNKGSKGSKGPNGRVPNRHQPPMHVLPNRAPVKIPGLASSGHLPNHPMAATVSQASVANPRMPSATNLTTARNPDFPVQTYPSPGIRDSKAQSWLTTSTPAAGRKDSNKAPSTPSAAASSSTVAVADAPAKTHVTQPNTRIPQVSTALEDVSNIPAPETAVGRDNDISQGAKGLNFSIWTGENNNGAVQEEQVPVLPGPNLADDLMDLDDDFMPNRTQSASDQNDLIDLNAPVNVQGTSGASGATAFDLFKLLIDGMGNDQASDLGAVLGDTKFVPDDNFDPARFITAVEDFVQGGSSQGQVSTLLDSAVDALPALKHLKALSPKKRCNCQSNTKAVYGLSASKYNDNRGEDAAADTQDKLFRYVIASAQQGATTRSALQVLLWYHDRECPDIQLAAQAYPILFGACPAITERADADPDGGLVVIEADRNDGHVDDDLDDELIKACSGNGFGKKRNGNRNRKGAQVVHDNGTAGEREVDQGFGYDKGLGYGQENQAYTFGCEQRQAAYGSDGARVSSQTAAMGAEHEASPRKKQTMGGLSSSRWA